MKKIERVIMIILKILVCAYLFTGMVFMGNLFLILFDFKPILPDSLANSILELVLENLMVTSFISFVFGVLTTRLICCFKCDKEIVKNVTVDEKTERFS